MATPRAVLFDLDGTLYDRDDLVQRLAAEQYEAFAEELEMVERERFVSRLLELDDHGYGEKVDVYSAIGEDFRLDDAVTERLLRDFWIRYDSLMVLPDEVLTTLTSLRQQGVPTGLVTNGRVDRQMQTIDSLAVASFLDVVLISEAEGIQKPDAEIFHRAARRLGVEVGAAVFVGNHPRIDIEGAVAAGMSAIWKFVPYWPPPISDVPAVRALDELLSMMALVTHEETT